MAYYDSWAGFDGGGPLIIDVSHYATPGNTSVIENVFGNIHDTSPQQAYDRANQIDPPYTGIVDASKNVSNAVGNIMNGISMAGAMLATVILLVIISIFKR